MKESGIVRRIDELGRIVIPKELRRTMRLRVGDELEINAAGDTLTLRKYSEAESIEKPLKAIAAKLSEATGADVLFIDSAVRAAEGKNKSKYSGAIPGENLSDAVHSRKERILQGEDLENLFENVVSDCCYAVTQPVMSNGDVFGALVLILKTMPSDVGRAYLHFTAELVSSLLDNGR